MTTFREVLGVPWNKANEMATRCLEPADDLEKDTRLFDEEVTFEDGMRMAIQIVSPMEPGKESSWSQAVLYDHDGCEIGFTDVCDNFLGPFHYFANDNEYIADVQRIRMRRVNSYYAEYWATGNWHLLGAVKGGRSSRFGRHQDAKARLEGAIDINGQGRCAGTVRGSTFFPEIFVHCGDIAQAISGKCPRCGRILTIEDAVESLNYLTVGEDVICNIHGRPAGVVRYIRPERNEADIEIRSLHCDENGGNVKRITLADRLISVLDDYENDQSS